MKEYIAEARLPLKAIRTLAKGGAITIQPAHLADEANQHVKLIFNHLKDTNHFAKQMRLGKGFRLNPKKMVKDIVHAVTGGSILGNLVTAAKVYDAVSGHGISNKTLVKGLMAAKHGLEQIGKPFEAITKKSIGVNLNPVTLGYDGGYALGMEMRKRGIGPKLKDGGELPHEKKVKKVLSTIKQGAVKVAKEVAKQSKQVYRNNKGEINQIGRVLAATAVDALNGEASKDDVKRAFESSVKEVGHTAARDRLSHAGVMKKDSYNHGQYKKHPPAPLLSADDETHDIVEGSGHFGEDGIGGFALVKNARVGSVADKMAWVRSHRKPKVKGGSFLLP